MKNFLCQGGDIYKYEGWLFEVHSFLGPWPLNKDYSSRVNAGRKFWDMWERFEQEQDKDRFKIKEGGCVPFEFGKPPQ